MVDYKLSSGELDALSWLVRNDGVLITGIPEKTEVDCIGCVTPGMNMFRKLEKKGLAFLTEEDPIFPEDHELYDPEDIWTPSLYLTEKGRNDWKDHWSNQRN